LRLELVEVLKQTKKAEASPSESIHKDKGEVSSNSSRSPIEEQPHRSSKGRQDLPLTLMILELKFLNLKASLN